MLRRMSLIGDALSHAILPGVAIGFLVAGLSVFAMAGGGLVAGFLITIGAGLVARATPLKEDASLAAFFLISLALGVVIVSVKGSDEDLVHFLFGSVLAINNPALAAHRRHRFDIASCPGVDLAAASARVCRSGISALGEPRRWDGPHWPFLRSWS